LKKEKKDLMTNQLSTTISFPDPKKEKEQRNPKNSHSKINPSKIVPLDYQWLIFSQTKRIN
jgi:hypothetical protein